MRVTEKLTPVAQTQRKRWAQSVLRIDGLNTYFNSDTGTVNAAVFTIPLRWNCTQIL